ncbi:MAG: metalloregulator ArsR/SmtB family transcription factor [Candidatus Neomarinimicrobiota bacterium]|jgi:DNA-binding transcriptional ArsR family regulator
MAFSKANEFNSELNELAQFAKAIAHPARIQILEHLAAKDSCFCGDIVKELPLSQSTVSQHLKALKEAGLIEGEVEAPAVCYCINSKKLEKIYKQLRALFSKVCNC